MAYLGTVGVPAEAARGFSLLIFTTFYLAGGLMGTVAWVVYPLRMPASLKGTRNENRFNGIVSFDLEMAGDRFTLFRGSSFREGAKVPRNDQETTFSVHPGRHSAQKV